MASMSPPRTPPRIFAKNRRQALRQRLRALQARPDAARYLIEDMIEDVHERLAFLRFDPRRVLVVGDYTGELARSLRAKGCEVIEADPADGFEEEQPYPFGEFDLIASLGTLDTVNDLPGALIHIRQALAKGGMMITSFLSLGSLARLREAMLEADGERPAPRLHPMVDVRAGGELLQRTGFADPVIDQRGLKVAFRSLCRLVGDLRAQGASNVLADPGPNFDRAALERASAAFTAKGEDGRTVETFEILTLSGWRK
ncbi:class I SAM-dependent methyltransferase [Novosphingobium profundi]|uniref:class I SAM-dependent methyltransferase n=1 Tax=Novosphingobium profundi TaxID=1774954 RepID=UPI001BDA0767|nr:class I SAM-dependent methyltransferase [Novosphingobium profundi]MBT0669012.1 class I SAM-dependent methyltransferase [Novosphingobium profundi]